MLPVQRLDELERQGSVRRVHGGAGLRSDDDAVPDELPSARHEVERGEEKLAIARSALDLVAPGSSVLLTGGTTTTALAPLLAGIPRLNIVTNTLHVAMCLAGMDVDLVPLGGSLRRPGLSLLGSLVGLGLDEVHVDHAIMGVYGIDSQRAARRERDGVRDGPPAGPLRRPADGARRREQVRPAQRPSDLRARLRLRARHLRGRAHGRPRYPARAGAAGAAGMTTARPTPVQPCPDEVV